MEDYGVEGSQSPVMPCSLEELRSSKSTDRLNQIALVRANGVSNHISLPQLVVCGDQSAGKSSVLEGITGIPFPRQDGVCTKFATEIILQHNPKIAKITASIIPHKSRSKADRALLEDYQRVISDFSELPAVIAEAGKDVLRNQVIGNIGLHLTVVDLPGLIANATDYQTEEDVQMVSKLVDSYLESSRTIILAVVQATNDIANQGIIQRARKVDPDGQRTVGIITKPDIINKGTEPRIALLAKNEDTTKLKLGYFLLKNPTPTQLKEGITPALRRKHESEFFSSPPWKDLRLNSSRLGVYALRDFLRSLLDRHIEKQLPKVRREIKDLLEASEAELTTLGEERSTTALMRMFLTRRSMEFQRLAQSALNGNYHDFVADFCDVEADDSIRLRAEIHRLNGNFAAYMRDDGQRRKLGSVSSDDLSVCDFELENGPISVSQKEIDSWVKKVYLRTRGRELPGNYNHALLSELFYEQSGRWPDIAKNHITKLYQLIGNFVEKTIIHVLAEEEMRQQIRILAEGKLEDAKHCADQELQRLLADEKRQPVTYNHYYTDNIQKARQEKMKAAIEKAMERAIDKDWNSKFHISNNKYDSDKLLLSLQSRVVVNMDDQACAEALAGLNAYYKVAMKTFVDNVCRQVIERHLLSALPEIFDPATVGAFSDEDLMRIASEPEKQRERRIALATLIQALRDSLKNLKN